MTRWNGPVIATVDMLMSLMVAFVVLATPPVKPVQGADKPICQLAIDSHWQDDLPVDVDLWVQAPGDQPVGYSAKNGQVADLVRDDLGTIYVGDKENTERVCARFIPDGDWTVNVHLYAHASPLPVTVDITVSLVDPSSAFMTEVLEKGAVLTVKGEEITVVRFTTRNGEVVPGSVHDIPKKLRAAGNSGENGR